MHGNTPTLKEVLTFQDAEILRLKKVMDYLYDGNQQTFAPLYFLKTNYKEWRSMFVWLVENQIKGKKLVEFFQNESPDGGGYHMGATLILSRIKGHKNNTESIKIDELN